MTNFYLSILKLAARVRMLVASTFLFFFQEKGNSLECVIGNAIAIIGIRIQRLNDQIKERQQLGMR